MLSLPPCYFIRTQALSVSLLILLPPYCESKKPFLFKKLIISDICYSNRELSQRGFSDFLTYSPNGSWLYGEIEVIEGFL
jgi:hypothetical protein